MLGMLLEGNRLNCCVDVRSDLFEEPVITDLADLAVVTAHQRKSRDAVLGMPHGQGALDCTFVGLFRLMDRLFTICRCCISPTGEAAIISVNFVSPS